MRSFLVEFKISSDLMCSVLRASLATVSTLENIVKSRETRSLVLLSAELKNLSQFTLGVMLKRATIL